MAKTKIVSTEDLKDRLQQGNNFHFWNVLTDDYFTEELIPGSRRVSLDRVGREVTKAQISKDEEIIVYCSGPSCPQSKLAAEKLINLGYNKVSAYEGGLEHWKSAGHEIKQFKAA